MNWEDELLLKIASDIYLSLISLPLVPPEMGGIIGERNGIVCKFFADSAAQTTDRLEYQPNVELLNRVIADWEKENVRFCGIFHTHDLAQVSLSTADLHYIKQVMMSLPKTYKKLCFPLIFPGIGVRMFVAKREKRGILIREDKTIIEGDCKMKKIVRTESENGKENTSGVKLPQGKLCGYNCADGCIYWNPYDRDSYGRQYCSYYETYYLPRERQGCFNFKN